MKRVVIATTFRDFNGSTNDEIQRAFLRSLKSQMYKNVTLVCTVFKEKKVDEELEKYDIDKVIFHSDLKEYKFSLSEVLINALNVASADDIVMWSNSDVLFEEDFLLNLTKSMDENDMGTCHPHIVYTSLQDYENKTANYSYSPMSGFDLVFAHARIFKQPDVWQILNTYKNVDWGWFESFMSAIVLYKNLKRANLYNLNSVYKIANDRKANNETNMWLKNSCLNNKKTLERFLNDYGISRKICNLMYCHYLFSFSFSDVSKFPKEYGLMIYHLLKLKGGTLIPAGMKKYIKTYIGQ